MKEAARERVMAYRQRGRSRPASVRVLVAIAGLLLLLAALPALVVLPEFGVPVLLLALRLLAVELDWAADAYAWVTWRWQQARAWFAGRSPAVRALIVLVLVAVAVFFGWLLIEEL